MIPLKRPKVKIPWVHTLIKSGIRDSNLVGTLAIYWFRISNKCALLYSITTTFNTVEKLWLIEKNLNETKANIQSIRDILLT